MKKIFLPHVASLIFLFVFVFTVTAFSQDDIIMQNNDVVKGKVEDVGVNTIKYRKADNMSGPLYELSKSDIYMIVYANGTHDVISTQPVDVAQTDNITAPGLYAEFTTSKGVIVCNLEYQKVPMTVGNFVALCEGKQTNTGKPVGQPFYDGIAFHRVIANFMIQGGDAAGNGTGTNTSYTFPDEFDPSLRFDGPGVLAMANRGPATNQTQFFITHVPTPWLNDKHSIFGKVMVGQTVVNAIAQGDVMTSVKIIRVGKEAEAFDGLKTYNEKLAEISNNQSEKDKLSQMGAEEFIKINYPTAIKTASGLYYVVQQEGTGARAVAGKSVSVHYTGTLADGSKFDSSRDRNQPITFTLGQGQVIKGWDEGIALMSVGAKYKLIIPYNLAYGEQGRPPVIPEKAMLIFDTELMDVK